MIAFLCIVGVMLSLYGMQVHIYANTTDNNNKNKEKQWCDINDRVSCSRAINSPYGKIIWNIPNPVLGVLYYTAVLISHRLDITILTKSIAVVGVLFSCFLGYILAFKIKTVCVICIAVYIVNIALLCRLLYA